MKKLKSRNPVARELFTSRFKPRVVESKKNRVERKAKHKTNYKQEK